MDYLNRSVEDAEESGGIVEFFASSYGLQSGDPDDVRPAVDDYIASRPDDLYGALLLAEVQDLIDRKFSEEKLWKLIKEDWLSQGGYGKYGSYTGVLKAVCDYLRNR